jgi:ATP-dependent RNA helicase RhlE
MQPQEHAFRSGVDVMVATPGRLLDHLKYPYAKLNHVEYLVLDEADRMLDMGFLPDVRRVLQYIPKKRQTLFFSATLPPPIVALTREMLHNPATLNVGRTSTPAVGITQAVYPVPQDLKTSLLAHLLESNVMKEALVFTRTKHRANRLWEFLEKRQIPVGRIHGNRSQAQRTDALEGFKSGRFRVLVATDIAARGIDVEALGHVVNFDVPSSPEDYVHRVGRTARAELTGEAFTFAAPDESEDLRAIERAVGKPLLRVTVPDFDYTTRRVGQLEIPLKERIAKIRAERAEARARSKAKEERRAAAQGGRSAAGEPARAPTPSQGPRREPPAAKRDDTPYRDGGAHARSDERRPAGGRSRGMHRGPKSPGPQGRSTEVRRPEGRGADARGAETQRPEGRGAEARGPTGRGAAARRGGRGGRRGSDRAR